MAATIAAQSAVSAEDIPMKRPHRKNFFQWVPTDDAQLRDAEGRMMRSLRNRYAQHVCAGLNTFSLLLAPEAALYIRRMSETLAALGGAAATATAHEAIASYLFGGSRAPTATASGAEQQPVALASSARLKVRHLVFIHGFGAGAPLWLPQLRYFAELADGHNTHVLRKLAEGLASSAASGAPSPAVPAAPESTATLLFVHAIDLPGFARSRRDVEEFADAEHVRAYMVEGLRQWVDAMALDSPARWCSLGVTLRTSTMPPSVQAVAAPDAALDAFITNRTGAVAALAELLLPQQQAIKKKKAALHQPPPTAEAIAAVTSAAGPQRVETATRAQWELVLAGHSFGGFLAGHFAAAHPDLVHHLILCDPWGVPHSDDPFENVKRLPFLIRKAAGLFMNGTLNPLSILRGLGPLGPTVIPKVRRDFGIRWRPLLTPSTERETRGLGRLGASPLSWHDRREQERQIQHRHRTEHGQQVNVTFPEALRWPHADDVIAAGLLGFFVDPAEAADTLHANVTAALLTFAARQQAAFLFEESTIEAFEAACGERAYRLQEHAYVQRKLEKRRAEVEKEQRCRKSSSRGCLGDDDVAVGGAGKSAGAFSPVGSLDGSTTAGATAAGTPASPVAPVTTGAATAGSVNGSVKSSAPSGQGADAEDSTDVDPWTQIFYDYIFHANARLPATGEAAMKMSNVGTGFARLPLQKTVPGALARSKIHVTAIYGRQTWMAPGCGRDLLEELRAQRVSALKESLEKQLEQDEAAAAAAGSIQAPPSHAQVDVEEPAPAGADADSAIPAAEAVRPKWAPKRVPMTGAQLTGKAPGVLFPATSDGRIPAAMFTQQDDGCIYDFAFVPRAGHQLNTDNPGDFNALMHRALRME